MKYRFEQCLQRGKIVRIPIDPELAAKELREARKVFRYPAGRVPLQLW
ncbi:hypothetical protein [Methanoculleus sp.]|jgi:hypothetical protein|nr:hypothetical protein [Methanoculleus sp.]